MTLTLILLAAIVIDYCVGELPNAYHPLVYFGRWVVYLENLFLCSNHPPYRQKIAGILAGLFALLPCLAILLIYCLPPILQTLFGIIILYFCIGASSLKQHAMAVCLALQDHDLPLARQRVGYIVSRQSKNMTEVEVRRAAIESVLENGADAVFAPLFWFVLLGPFGALLYRLANTLDAMWGYKNTRYINFGWGVARFDDVLNWFPARLTALSYALLGNTYHGLMAWFKQSSLLESPNAGPVMTAGAGALNLRLGGPAFYHGQLKNKPWFGGDKEPDDHDIELAVQLIYRTLSLWFISIVVAQFDRSMI